MKAEIQHSHAPFEVYFIHEGVKYNFLSTNTDGEGNYYHEVQNSVSKGVKTIPHSKLEMIVKF
jgi:hypothetical protein